MSKTFTRVQNEKFVAAQNDIVKSVADTLASYFTKAYAFTVWTSDNKSHIAFNIQKEDGSVVNDSITFPSVLCYFTEEKQ